MHQFSAAPAIFMKRIFTYRRSAITISIFCSCIVILTQCMNNEKEKPVTPAKITAGQKVTMGQFAGSESCAGCHKNIYEDHIHTAHYLTTRPALEKYIKGSFAAGKNSFAYDSGRIVVMEKRDSGFYQVGYYQGVEHIARRFDMVVGSGSKGQTYITRVQNQFYQLPVSYFTAAKNWANSPLYPTYPVLFNRPITSRCLECHTTFAQKVSAPGMEPEEFDARVVYGVDCEKCHGPAAKHVEYELHRPKDGKSAAADGKATVAGGKAPFILNPAAFSRQQNLDLCALCHGGRLQKTKPSFEFVSGDRLADYFLLDTLAPDPDHIDVHGNQYGLLRASKCFRMSQTMTCTTCHHPHENERGMTALFSQRCMGCHGKGQGHTCKMTASMGAAITQNCINCHMPLKASKSITELLQGDNKPTAALIRSHFIAIYPDETMKYKAGLHQQN